ncbi:MAG: hypothetical protein EON58_05930 [Alphaproteobacteria bacterium]|nr:MAG: hypothetical protein EON58_05930 [Alphaproteobacteria bacterium]
MGLIEENRQRDKSLNFFTCANKAYEDFVPIFVSSVLWSNPNSTVEIGLENAEEYLSSKAGRHIVEEFGDKVKLRTVNWKSPGGRNILPNSIRFINQPSIKSDYVYISDIDIVTLVPDIILKHLTHMAQIGLPFSNIVRPGTNRLTGLHFAEYDFQYPISDVSDLIEGRINDEVLLYNIVQRKLERPIEISQKFRPVHGIHVSPNRQPRGHFKNGVKRPGWGISLHRKAWAAFRSTSHFRAMESFVSDRQRGIIAQIDEVAGKGELDITDEAFMPRGTSE